MRKSLVSVCGTNPATIQLHSDLSHVNRLELIYAKLSGLDLANIPQSLFVRIDGVSTIRSDLVITGTDGTARLRSDNVPLYMKLEGKYTDGVTDDLQYPVLHGKQPKLMRWRQENIGVLGGFQVTLVDGSSNRYALNGGTITLVFDVEYSTGGQVYKGRTAQNSLNA